MLYEQYEERVKRYVKVKNIIVKYRILIISILSAIVALATFYMASAGGFAGDISITDTSYGEEVEVSGNALFSRVSYEYFVDGEWTTTKPTSAGIYKARGVARNAFGYPRYSNIVEFEIKKRSLELKFSDNQPEYGDEPLVEAIGLLDSDTFISALFDIENKNSILTNVELIKDSVVINDENNENVAANYEIIYPGKQLLTFKKRTITIELISQEKAYDGKALALDTNESSFKLDKELAFNQSISNIIYNGSITNYGTKEVSIDINKNNIVIDNNEELFSNYEFNVIPANLTINKRDIAVTTEGLQDITYDGKIHKNEEYSYRIDSLEGNTLFDDEAIEITPFKEFINANTYKNEIEVVIKHNGLDVTYCYNITYNYGDIIINPLNISIKPKDVLDLVYDGTLKTYESTDFEYVEGSNRLAEDDILLVTKASASLVDATEATNKILEFTITNKGNSVKDNYIVNIDTYSKFIVNKRNIKVKLDDLALSYNGYNQAYEDNSNSYLLLDNTSLAATDTFIITKTNTESKNVITNNNAKILEFEIKNDKEVNVNDNYIVDSSTPAAFIINPYHLSISPKAIEVEYSGNTYSYSDEWNNFIALNNTNILGDDKLRISINYYINNGIATPISAKKYTTKIENIEFIDDTTKNNYIVDYQNDSYLDIARRAINIKLLPYSFTYDGATHSYFDDFTSYEIINGIGNHQITFNLNEEVYKLAGTINLNVIKDSVKITDELHNDVTSNYNITSTDSTVTVLGKEITITLLNLSTIYDSKSHSYLNTVDEIDGINSLCKNDRFYFTTKLIDSKTEVIDVGDYLYNIDNFYITNEKNELYTDNYVVTIKYTEATGSYLSITKRNFEASLIAQEFTYDGLSYSYFIPNSYQDVVEDLIVGDTLTFDTYFNGNNTLITNSGVYTASAKNSKIVDINNKDVTNNYNIIIHNTTYTINRRAITIESIPDKMVVYKADSYSYTELAEDKLYIITGVLGFNDEIVVNNQYYSHAGTYKYDLDSLLDITNNSNDSSGNYDITYIEHSLTINKFKLTIAPIDDYYIYDGNYHTYLERYNNTNLSNFFTIETEEAYFPNNFSYQATASSVSLKYATDGKRAVTVESLYIEDNLNKLSNSFNDYEITFIEGMFYIQRRTISIKPMTVKAMYNGAIQPYAPVDLDSASTPFEYTSLEYTLVNDDVVKLTFTPDNFINRGVYTISILSAVVGEAGVMPVHGSNYSENYSFIFSAGEYEITPRPVKIAPHNVTDLVYSGSNQSYNDLYTSIESWRYTADNNYEICSNHTLSVKAIENEYINALEYKANLDASTLNIVDNTGESISWYYQKNELDDDGASNYLISFEASNYVIKRRKIIVNPYDERTTYTSYPLGYSNYSYNNFKYVESMYKMVDDEYLYIITSTFLNKEIEVGKYDNTIVYYYVSKDSNVDINSLTEDSFINNRALQINKNYEFYTDSYSVATFEIVQREITIAPVNITGLKYIGVAYSYSDLTGKNNYQIVNGSLGDNDSLSISYDQILLNADTYNIIYDIDNVSITRSNTSVIDNYLISYEAISIVVSKQKATITLSNQEIMYDGLTHTYDNTNFTVTYESPYFNASLHEYSLEVLCDDLTYVTEGEKSASIITSTIKATLKVLDVTNNFEFSCVDGSFKIVKRPISIKPVDIDDIIYDGNTHDYLDYDFVTTNYEFVAASLTICDNESIALKFTNTKFTDRGNYEIGIIEAKVLLNNTLDITGNYEITYTVLGSYIINPREITIKPNDITDLIYNGKAQYFNDYVFTGSNWCYSDNTKYQLVEGHNITLAGVNNSSFVDSFTYNSEIDSTSVVIADNKNNVISYSYDGASGNYTIKLEKGKLVINPREITIKALDDSTVYNALPQSNSKLVDGKNWCYIGTPGVTNTVLTNEYIIVITEAMLNPLTNVLRDENNNVIAYNIKPVYYYVSKSYVDISYLTEADFIDNMETTAYKNYKINIGLEEELYSKFTILPYEIAIKPCEGIEVVYDGTIGNPNNDLIKFKDKSTLKWIYESSSNHLLANHYLICDLKSNNALIDVGEYDALIDLDTIRLNDSDGNSVISNYDIITYSSKFNIIKRNISISPINISSTANNSITPIVYDGNYHNLIDYLAKYNSENSTSYLPYVYNQGSLELALRDSIEISILLDGKSNARDAKAYESSIDSATLVIYYSVGNKKYSSNNNYNITLNSSVFEILKRDVSVKLLDKEITYDGLYHYTGINNLSILDYQYANTAYPMVTSEELVIYGKYGELGAKDAGSYEVSLFSYDILNGNKDNYNILFNNTKAKLEIKPMTISIELNMDPVEYMGKEYQYDSKAYQLKSEMLDDTYLNVYVLFNDKLIDAKKYQVRGYTFDVLNDNKNNYVLNIINLKTYEFEILRKEISIKPYDYVITYDGNQHNYDDYYTNGLLSSEIYSGTLCDNHKLISYHSAKGYYLANSYNNTVSSYQILDENDLDVTNNYLVDNTKSSTFTINRRTINLKPIYLEVEYTGKELKYLQACLDLNKTPWEYKDGNPIASTDSVNVLQALAYGTSPGVYSNRLMKLEIINNRNEDVTGSYDLSNSYNNVELFKIISRHITLSLNNGELTYDGQSHAYSEFVNSLYTINSGSLRDTDSLLFTGLSYNDLATLPKNSGSYVVKALGYKVLDKNEVDVTSCYEITILDAVITINKVKLTITPYKVSAVYNGLTHNYTDVDNYEYNYDPSGLIGTDRIKLTDIEGSGIAPGSYPVNVKAYELGSYVNNVFTKNDSLASNYEITFGEGTLEIEKRTISIELLSKVLKKTDEELSYPTVGENVSYKYSSSTSYKLLASDTLYVYTSLGTVAEAGTYKHILTSVKILDSSNNDVTSYYNVESINYTTPVDFVITLDEISIMPCSYQATYTGEAYSFTAEADNYQYYVAPEADIKLKGYTLTITSVRFTKNGKEVNPIDVDTYTIEILDYRITKGEEDHTNLFVVNKYTNTLVIKKKTIVVKPQDKDIEYTASAITTDNPTPVILDNGGSVIKLNDTASITVSFDNSIINIGDETVVNVVNLAITNNGIDKSSNYSITYETGVYRVVKRNIAISPYDDTVVYNGLEIAYSKLDINGLSYKITAGSILSGHSLNITYSAKGTNAGTYTNSILSIKAVDELNNDVSSIYEFDLSDSVFTISKRNIILTVQSEEVLYDGNSHYYSKGYTYDKDNINEILESHNLDVSYQLYYEGIKFNNPINAYSYDIKLIVNDIKDSSNNSVKDNYSFECNTKDLKFTINKRSVIIKPYEVSISYDRLAHSYTGGYQYAPNTLNTLVEGDYIEFTSTIVDVIRAKVYDNVLSDFKVYTLANNDVTDNYIITNYQDDNGYTKYIIEGSPINIRYDDYIVSYNGLNQEYNKEYLSGNISSSYYRIITELGDLHPEDSSEILNPGDYLVVDAPGISYKNIGKYDLAISTDSIHIYDKDGNDVTESYIINHDYAEGKYTSRFEIIKIKLEIMPIDSNNTYQGKMICYNELNELGNNWNYTSSSLELLDGHKLTAMTKYSLNGETSVGNYINTITSYSIVDTDGNDVSMYYEVNLEKADFNIVPIEVHITANSEHVIYDGKMHSYNISYKYSDGSNKLLDNDVLVVTTKSELKLVNVGKLLIEFNFKAFNGIDDISSNYSFIQDGEAYFEITAASLKLKPELEEVYYDNTPHKYSLGYIGIDLSLLPDGYTIAVVEASVADKVNVSTEGYDNAITRVIIKDELGVDRTSNFIINDDYSTEKEEYINKFIILPREIVIQGIDVVYDYTGSDIFYYAKKNGVNYIDVNNKLIASHRVAAYNKEYSQILPGNYEFEFNDIKIYDEVGNDISANYDIKTIKSSFVINRINVAITPKTQTVEYTGYTQNYIESFDNWSYTSEHTVKNEIYKTHRFMITKDVINEANVGDYQVVVNNNYIVVDSDGNDVSSCYSFTFSEGIFTIVPYIISFSLKNESLVYNFSNQEYPKNSMGYYDYEMSDKDKAKLGNNTLIITGISVSPDAVSEIGTYKVGATGYIIIDPDGVDVSSNYHVEYDSINNIYSSYGTLEITRIPIKVALYDFEATYNNTYIEYEVDGNNNKYMYVSDDYHFRDSDTLSFTTKKYINAGSYKNEVIEYKVYNGNIDVTEYYYVLFTDSSFTIKKEVLTIKVNDTQLEYDGKYHSSTDYTLVSGTVYQGILEISCDMYVKDAQSYVNKLVSFSIRDNEEVMTDNYSVIATDGVLTITKKAITVKLSDFSKEYDGTRFTVDYKNLNETVEGLVPNEDYVINSILLDDLSIINVSDSIFDNRVTKITIYDKEKADTTDNYEIEYQESSVTITQKPITLDFTKKLVYNGEAQGYKVLSEKCGILKNDLEYFYTESTSAVTHVSDGLIRNNVEVKCSDEIIQNNYLITIKDSYISISPLNVFVKVAGNKVYDGTALTVYSDSILITISNDIKKDNIANYLVIDSDTSITLVGKVNVIMNNMYLDNYIYKSDYSLSLDNDSILEIKKYDLYLNSMSMSKYVDGTPLYIPSSDTTNLGTALKDDVYDYDNPNSKLPVGHSLYGNSSTIVYSYTGSRVDNDFSIKDIRIYNSDGLDVTASFNLIKAKSLGKLELFRYVLKYYALNKTTPYSSIISEYTLPQAICKTKEIELDPNDINKIGNDTKPTGYTIGYQAKYMDISSNPTAPGSYRYIITSCSVYLNDTIIGDSGRSDLPINVVVYDSDVASNIGVYTIKGIALTITPQSIELSHDKYMELYNGEAIEVTEYSATLSKNYTVERIGNVTTIKDKYGKVYTLKVVLKSLTAVNGITEADGVPIEVESYSITDENGNDCSIYFQVTTKTGTIKIS